MLGSNATITVARLVEDGYGQKTYTAAHLTCSAYIEPASAEIVMASGGPVGQLWSIFTDSQAVPGSVQISDLITDTATGVKYLVTGILPYQNHLQVTASSYAVPSF